MCGLRKSWGSLQALLQDCNGEGDRIMNTVTEEQVLDILECLFHGQPDQIALALMCLREEEEEGESSDTSTDKIVSFF